MQGSVTPGQEGPACTRPALSSPADTLASSRIKSFSSVTRVGFSKDTAPKAIQWVPLRFQGREDPGGRPPHVTVPGAVRGQSVLLRGAAPRRSLLRRRLADSMAGATAQTGQGIELGGERNGPRGWAEWRRLPGRGAGVRVRRALATCALVEPGLGAIRRQMGIGLAGGRPPGVAGRPRGVSDVTAALTAVTGSADPDATQVPSPRQGFPDV